MDHLPPAPNTLPELLKLLNDPDAGSDRIVELLTYDTALTANLLRLCNSAFMGAARPAEDIGNAVTWLGFRTVFQLVAAISGTRSLVPAQEGYGLERGELWKHAVMAAVAA